MGDRVPWLGLVRGIGGNPRLLQKQGHRAVRVGGSMGVAAECSRIGKAGLSGVAGVLQTRPKESVRGVRDLLECPQPS